MSTGFGLHTNSKIAAILYFSLLSSFSLFISQDGFSGWFRGMEAKLWQTVLTAAFQFVTYEQTQMLIFKLLLGDKYQVCETRKSKSIL